MLAGTCDHFDQRTVVLQMDNSQRSTLGEATVAGSECTPRTSQFRVSPGHASPLGIQDCLDGFNFAIFSRHAERIELLLFEKAPSGAPVLTIDLGRTGHRTGDVWHALVGGVQWGQPYAYRAYGPWSPGEGQRSTAESCWSILRRLPLRRSMGAMKRAARSRPGGLWPRTCARW